MTSPCELSHTWLMIDSGEESILSSEDCGQRLVLVLRWDKALPSGSDKLAASRGKTGKPRHDEPINLNMVMTIM